MIIPLLGFAFCIAIKCLILAVGAFVPTILMTMVLLYVLIYSKIQAVSKKRSE